jgi:hypothetical protein
MNVVSVELDFPIEPIPRSLENKFEWTADDGERYLYITQATNLKWDGDFTVRGTITLAKLQKMPMRWRSAMQGKWWCEVVWWREMWKREMWKELWSFSEYGSVTHRTRGTVGSTVLRERLTKTAVDRGVMLTELLLGKALRPIESRLHQECRRLQELSRSKGTRSAVA